MSHTEKRQEIEEWEIEVCDDCGHEASQHYDVPKEETTSDASWWWEGCIVHDSNGRWLRGNNPYKRCKCMKLK